MPFFPPVSPFYFHAIAETVDRSYGTRRLSTQDQWIIVEDLKFLSKVVIVECSRLKLQNPAAINTLEETNNFITRGSQLDSHQYEGMVNLFFERSWSYLQGLCRMWSDCHKSWLSILMRLRKNVRRKLPDLCSNKDWFVHHDTKAAQTAISVRKPDATPRSSCLSAYSTDLGRYHILCFER